MNLLGKLQNQYESVWKQIIRPSRAHYSQQALGPKQFNLEREDVCRIDFQMQNMQDNKFQGSLWAPAKQRKSPCVIYLHSSTGNRTEGMEYLGKIIKSGYSLCTFDFCGCGNADGNFITMGYYQQHQVNQVIGYLKETLQIEQFCLWGREMGAVSGLQVLGKTMDVKACIMDCPYKSLKGFVEQQLKKQFKVPSLLISGAVKMISKTIEDKAGFDIQNVNPCKFSVPGLHLPVYFIFVGGEDGTIGENDKKLFEAYAGSKKKLYLLSDKQGAVRKQRLVDSCLQFISSNLNSQKNHRANQQQFDFFQAATNIKRTEEHTQQREANLFNQQNQRQSQKQQQNNKEIKKSKDYSLKGIFSFFMPDLKQPEKPPAITSSITLKDEYIEFRKEVSDIGCNKQGFDSVSSVLPRSAVNKYIIGECNGEQSINLKRWVYVQIE